MMSRARPCVLFAGPARWRLGSMEGGVASVRELAVTGHDAADHVAAAVGAESGPCELVLAVPSAWCLCAIVDNEPSRGRHWREAMLYALEQKLPLAAEQVAADFVVHGDRALGVAVPLDRITPLVDALREHDVAVSHICPTAMLALASGADDDANAWIVGEDGDVAVLQLSEGTPAGWHWLGGGIDGVAERLAMLSAQPRHVATIGLTATQTEQLMPALALGPSHGPGVWEAATHEAWRIGRGRQQPWINLARGPLAYRGSWTEAQRPLRWTVASLLLLLVAINAGLLYRTHRLDQLQHRQKQLQQDMFAQVLGGRAPNTMIARRMESEYLALTQQPQTRETAPENVSALRLVWEVFASLPVATPIQWTHVQFDRGQLHLEGRAASPEAVEQLAVNLRANDAFEISPPQADARGAGDVAFRIEGRWWPETPTGEGGGSW